MRHFLTGLCCLCLAPAAAAQTGWTLTGEVGANRFSRAAHDTSSPAVSLGAWRPTSYTLRLARSGTQGVLTLSAGFTPGSFAAWIENVAVVQDGELALYEFGLSYGRRIVHTGAGAAIRVEGGPVVHLWTMSGEDPRTRLGAQIGTVVELPMTERWRVDVRADLTLTKSWMRPEDEDAEITREPTMRRGRLALGLTRRL